MGPQGLCARQVAVVAAATPSPSPAQRLRQAKQQPMRQTTRQPQQTASAPSENGGGGVGGMMAFFPSEAAAEQPPQPNLPRVPQPKAQPPAWGLLNLQIASPQPNRAPAKVTICPRAQHRAEHIRMHAPAQECMLPRIPELLQTDVRHP